MRNWKARGKCIGVDVELFFSDHPGEIKIAKEICKGCPVIAECLRDSEPFGIWAGLTRGERIILRNRNRVPAA